MLAFFVHALLAVSWPHALVFALPLGLAAAPVSLSAWYVCRSMPLARVSAWQVGLTALGAAVMSAAVWSTFGRLWWTVLHRAWPSWPGPQPGTLFTLLIGLGALAYLVSVTVHYLFQAFEDSTRAAREVLVAQIAHRDAELRALRAQIDPHFLFNSLNSVAGLVTVAPERARVMCQMLGDFLRDSLTLGSSRWLPLGREVQLARQYLAIEQVRFGARLTVACEVAEDASSVSVPPLILQPLVENAVRHGVATRLDGGQVSIDARRVGDVVVIGVTNPRDPDVERRGTGFGLDIVRRRLAAAFGGRAALSVESTADAYRVTLTVPAPVEPVPVAGTAPAGENEA